MMPDLLARVEAVAQELVACGLVAPGDALKAAHLAATIMLAEDGQGPAAARSPLFVERDGEWAFLGPASRG